jgi:predicted amino acid racemase
MPLVCTVELDKTGGIVVTVDNADGKTKQTITMDGAKIELKVAGESGTSTITQTAQKIAIACKQLEIAVEETIQVKSGKASTWTSGDAYSVKSTKDATIASDANAMLSAQQKVTVQAQTEVSVAGAGQNKLTLAAAGATLSTPSKLRLEGKAQIAAQGAMVEVKADGTMLVESAGMTTVKGAMTNVQGNLVSLG